MEVKRTERGWIGHFILADRCRFRRNTLLEYGSVRIVISTVGLLRDLDDTKFRTVGVGRYFETMAFHANSDERCRDPDVQRQVNFDSPWSIKELDADDKANEMHETVVTELIGGLLQGNVYAEEGG